MRRLLPPFKETIAVVQLRLGQATAGLRGAFSRLGSWLVSPITNGILTFTGVILTFTGVLIALYVLLAPVGGPKPAGPVTPTVTPESVHVTPTSLATATATVPLPEATRPASPTPEPTPYLDWVSIDRVDPYPAIAGEDMTFIADVGTNLDIQGDFCFTWQIFPGPEPDGCTGPEWTTTAPVPGQYRVVVRVEHAPLVLSGFRLFFVHNSAE